MHFIKCLVLVFGVITISQSIKVDMQGSLSFGKDVVDSLMHFARRSYSPARRSMALSAENSVIHLTIKSSILCRELAFCEGTLEIFLNDYITLLTKSIETVFQTITKQKLEYTDGTEKHVFEEELKKILPKIRGMLETANSKITDKNVEFLWIDLIKKISALFQETAIAYATDGLEDTHGDNSEVKKKLMQKFVIATVVVEGKYGSELCAKHKICNKFFECTNALNTFLKDLQKLDGDKTKKFFRDLSESLLETTFYSHVSDSTKNDFPIILNDLAYADNESTKGVLLSIQRTVEERLNPVKSNTQFAGGKDVELVHVILSDMDHIYVKRRVDPFHAFFRDFYEWVGSNDKSLRASIRDVLKQIGEVLSHVPSALQMKLIREVRVFLELTVDTGK